MPGCVSRHTGVTIMRVTLYTDPIVQYTVYSIHCTLYTVHCVLYTLHCTLYSNCAHYGSDTGVVVGQWEARRQSHKTHNAALHWMLHYTRETHCTAETHYTVGNTPYSGETHNKVGKHTIGDSYQTSSSETIHTYKHTLQIQYRHNIHFIPHISFTLYTKYDDDIFSSSLKTLYQREILDIVTFTVCLFQCQEFI